MASTRASEGWPPVAEEEEEEVERDDALALGVEEAAAFAVEAARRAGMRPAMQAAISECERRRTIQIAFNTKHGITPATIEKAINLGIEEFAEAQEVVMQAAGQSEEEFAFASYISDLEQQMESAARNLEFEKAAMIRDKIKELKNVASH